MEHPIKRLLLLLLAPTANLALVKSKNRLAVYIGDLGIFLNGLAKSPRLIVLNIE